MQTPHRKVKSMWPTVEFKPAKKRNRTVVAISRNSPYKSSFFKHENEVIRGGNQNHSNLY